VTQFQEIQIVTLDVGRTRPTQHTPSGLRLMHLKLSGRPDHRWSKIFTEGRIFPRHSMWRNAWIEGDYIVVECDPDEIEKYHLNDLKQDVKTSNQKYIQLIAEEEQKRKSNTEAISLENERLNGLKDRLNFD